MLRIGTAQADITPDYPFQTRFNPDAGELIRDASSELIAKLIAGPAPATIKDTAK